MLDPGDVAIGRRISCEGHYATIRYYGEVKGTNGQWLGVEWDDPARGKHDGSHKGVKYFNTSHPTGGSFIRPQKVDFGISCPEAIREKYFSSEVSTEGDKDVVLIQTSSSNRIVEFVGAEKIANKQSQGVELIEVILHNLPLNGAGSPGELEQLSPNIRLLDLSYTLLITWEQIADITKQLKRLECLNVSKNVLQLPKNPHDLRSAFQSIKKIALEKVEHNWDEVLRTALLWPHIEELELAFNRISILRVPSEEIFYKLRQLSLQENPILSWEEVCKLGHLPSLEILFLNNTGLSSIKFPEKDPGQKTTLFGKLKWLEVTNNQLKEWRDVAELNKLENLEVLRITKNPVIMQESFTTGRQLVIARLGNILSLDRAEITRQERRGAELDYIKKFFHMWLKSGGKQELETSSPSLEFQQEHPRYYHLLKVHGVPEESELKKMPTTLKSTLINVSISFPQSPEKVPVEKKLPATMTVAKLKALVRQLSPKRNKRLFLTYLSGKENEHEYELNNDFRELSFYDLTDGDQILARW